MRRVEKAAMGGASITMDIDVHKEGEHAVDPGFRGLVGMGRRSGGERPLADISWSRRRAVLQSVVVARDTEATRTALKARELRLLGLFLCGGTLWYVSTSPPASDTI